MDEVIIPRPICRTGKTQAAIANQKLPRQKIVTLKPQRQRQQSQPPKAQLLRDTLNANIDLARPPTSSGLSPLTLLERLTGNSTRQELSTKTPTRLQSMESDSDLLDSISSNKSRPKNLRQATSKSSSSGSTFTLNHFSAITALESLIVKYGRISHMGILDPSYAFFLTKSHDAALYYKVKNDVAVVGGDPLCSNVKWDELLTEFAHFRKRHALGIAFLGATRDFRDYAMKNKGYVAMRFGIERALNPVESPVVLEKEAKRLVKQNRQLLDPKRGGMHVHVYVAVGERDLELEEELVSIYEEWRASHNKNGKQQAYMTVLEPFALPRLMIYVYTTDSTGRANGFAALRRMDAMGGYQIDPCCARSDAPKGTSDLLVYSCLVLLNRAGVTYLGLGFQPNAELSEVQGLSKTMTNIILSAYRKSTARLPLEGKRAYNDKWCPDPAYDAAVYIIYPCQPDLHHSLATMHFANVSAREIMRSELKQAIRNVKANLKRDPTSDADSLSSGRSSIDLSGTEREPRSTWLKPFNLQQGIVSASRLPLQLGMRAQQPCLVKHSN